MRSMESYLRAAMERAMKVQEVMLQAMAKKITWFSGSGDHWHQRPAHAAVAGMLRGERLSLAV
jgi:hypothetical protein